MDELDVEHLDELIVAGVGASRSQVIRTALEQLYDRHRRAQVAEQIVASYTQSPQTAEDDEWARQSLDDWLGSNDAPG
ncbi:hypothetical protein BH24ACT5_BH24ACT5_18540 [soil metagenome]